MINKVLDWISKFLISSLLFSISVFFLYLDYQIIVTSHNYTGNVVSIGSPDDHGYQHGIIYIPELDSKVEVDLGRSNYYKVGDKYEYENPTATFGVVIVFVFFFATFQLFCHYVSAWRQ